MIISEATSRLAGRLGGLHFSDGGRVRLKNIADPVHVYKVYSELDARPTNRWTVMIFGKERPGLSWRLGLIVVLIAAATATAVVYLTAGGGAEPSGAADSAGGETRGRGDRPRVGRPARRSGRTVGCRPFRIPGPTRRRSACRHRAPDRWEISRYPNGLALNDAYRSELGKRADLERDSGKCNAFVWGGEGQWKHGPNKPGGHVFCYFDGNDAVIVWSHERLGQPTHKDILVIARAGGSDHRVSRAGGGPGTTRSARPASGYIRRSTSVNRSATISVSSSMS